MSERGFERWIEGEGLRERGWRGMESVGLDVSQVALVRLSTRNCDGAFDRMPTSEAEPGEKEE